jgi:hypothetical protein
MFDFFRKRTAKEFIAEANENYMPPTVEPIAVPKRGVVAYRVGKTEDGKVTLSLGEYSDSTVTMNNDGVNQLIRMLEAAKEPETVDDPQEAN